MESSKTNITYKLKNYALYIILFVCCGCGSSKRTSHTSVHDTSYETKKEVTTQAVQQQKQSTETVSIETNTLVDEEIVLVTYDTESGNVQSVQKTRRQTGRNELGNSTRSGSEDTQLDNTSNTDTNSQTNIELDEHRESKGDSRLVQGIEFLWIVIPIGVIIAIVYLIRNGKKKHNS